MRKNLVAIVDDHKLLAQALESLVNSFSDFEVSYICKNGKELIDTLKTKPKHPDIVLMDVNMPVLNGIQTTNYLSIHFPCINVIALSVENKKSHIVSMFKAGAKSYLLKDVEKCVLEEALNKTLSNGFYYTQNVSNILMRTFTGQEDNTFNLKDREVEFIRYVCTEYTYKEIADKMFLSPKTIDGYRNSLFTKLKVRNRTGLVLYAIRNKLIEP